MDLQQIIDSHNKKLSSEAGAEYNLGDFVKDLEKCDQEAIIKFDDNKKPQDFASWRGSYCNLALSYEIQEWHHNEDFFDVKVKDILEKAKDTIGKTFTGWKGGDFLMDESTPIYIANQGDSKSPKHSSQFKEVVIENYWKIVGIEIVDNVVIIKSKICEFYGNSDEMLEDIKKILS